MSLQAFALILLSQICLVGGQILIKHAMEQTNRLPPDWKKFRLFLPLGIIVFSGWFFVWLGLMKHFDLSVLYPFEGLSPILLAVGASIFLREKFTLRLGIGILIMTLGMVLISRTT
ncbi:MAG: EamA family transporter [Verrucomicrobiae bacterium]|nr:EamA family transporter [Verrucomicrobiae bacterium]